MAPAEPPAQPGLILQAGITNLCRAQRQSRSRMASGRVERVSGTMIQARISGLRVGELCRLRDPAGAEIEAEVIGVGDGRAFLAPIGEVAGFSARAEVVAAGRRLSVGVGIGLLGRVLDGLGRPIDADAPLSVEARLPIDGAPPPPLLRPPVNRALPLGTRALDGLLTCAEGQRMGIFGPAGAGKSSLIARIVRGAEAEVFVVALVGERGREVGEFLEHTLGRAARHRAVVVAATSDRPALERVKAAQVATTIAEWFRDRGKRVVLLVDGLTRLARAWREIGLAAGEPPTRRGFPPSVFAALPRLLERAASTQAGSITGFYTVLAEGDLALDPVAEEVKSILDGHIILSAKLAEAEHHPAIDILASRSRVMDQVVSRAHREAAAQVRRLLARYEEIELLLRVGEYQRGNDRLGDEAVAKIEAIRAYLREPGREATSFAAAVQGLRALAAASAT
jgi:type III secretion protein N (ATPase)